MEATGLTRLSGLASFTISLASLSGALAEEGKVKSADPSGTEQEDFEALRNASPFVRVLDPAQTYALRGVAEVNDVAVATLYNRETGESFLVTPDSENSIGMRLVEVDRDEALESVTIRVFISGEEVELTYDPEQFTSAPRVGPGQGQKGKGSGKRRGPSKEEVQRYQALPPEKQKVFQRYLKHVMETYPEMPRDERNNMLRGALIRLTDGQELEFEQSDQTR